MHAILSAAETSEGVYASIPVLQEPQQSREQYKAVYDYGAQVSFSARTSHLYTSQIFKFFMCWRLFLFLSSGRMSSLCLVVMS